MSKSGIGKDFSLITIPRFQYSTWCRPGCCVDPQGEPVALLLPSFQRSDVSRHQWWDTRCRCSGGRLAGLPMRTGFFTICSTFCRSSPISSCTSSMTSLIFGFQLMRSNTVSRITLFDSYSTTNVFMILPNCLSMSMTLRAPGSITEASGGSLVDPG